jgi:probable FeS assembly SUF system protein SufT
MNNSEEIILKRDCPAVLIPSGEAVTLKAGEAVWVTQSLGGTHTVNIRGNLARIDAANADALGIEAAAPGSQVAAGPLTEEAVYNAMRDCYDPEIPVNIVDLGLIYDLHIAPLAEGGSRVEIKMTLTAPGCGMGPVLQQDVASRIQSLPGVKEVDVAIVWEPPWNREMLTDAAKLELGLM